jgi:hypothetical protein
MERRRAEEGDGRQWQPLRRGWFLGSEEFRAKLLERMEPPFGEHHSGQLRRESAAAKAGRITAEEPKRAKWKEKDLEARPKSDPVKPALALRLRRETTLTIRKIAGRLHVGTWKSLNNKLYLAAKAKDKGNDEKAEK